MTTACEVNESNGSSSRCGKVLNDLSRVTSLQELHFRSSDFLVWYSCLVSNEDYRNASSNNIFSLSLLSTLSIVNIIIL